AQRVELHRRVWHPSRVTLQSYTEMRQVVGYDPELDLVMEAPDGTFAAYCVCWIDQQNGLGLFEPVGTHPDFRQQGLGKALLTEGLRRLHARGAGTALVTTGGSNAAARRLYEGVGFSVLHHSHDFVREIHPPKLA
ncbi:MAG: GNAT family N-acetyltransferase, partial [Chloroflexota bacterium]|nr:GNAT family N-acetyltransferase [Chloroflexota bacterium]